MPRKPLKSNVQGQKHIVACDIGRSKIMLRADGGMVVQYDTQSFSSEKRPLYALVNKVMEEQKFGAGTTHWFFSVPAPVYTDRIEIPDLPIWSFSLREARSALGLASLEVMNDMVAAIFSIPVQIEARSYARVVPGIPHVEQPLAVIWAGESAGASMAFSETGSNEIWRPLGSEAAHISLVAFTDQERDLIDRISSEGELVTGQSVLTESGFKSLATAIFQEAKAELNDLCQINGSVPFHEQLYAIAHGKNSDVQALADKTIHIWSYWMGSFARDVALCFGAQAGVYLIGTLPCLFLSDDNPENKKYKESYYERFRRGGPTDTYLKNLPTYLLTDPNPFLLGLCRLGPPET